eukprot:3764651-Amphidinium_carterae.1
MAETSARIWAHTSMSSFKDVASLPPRMCFQLLWSTTHLGTVRRIGPVKSWRANLSTTAL